MIGQRVTADPGGYRDQSAANPADPLSGPESRIRMPHFRGISPGRILGEMDPAMGYHILSLAAYRAQEDGTVNSQ